MHFIVVILLNDISSCVPLPDSGLITLAFGEESFLSAAFFHGPGSKKTASPLTFLFLGLQTHWRGLRHGIGFADESAENRNAKMPKKKGVKKKKVKKKKKISSSGIGDSLGGIEVQVAEKVDRFVNCQMKLINWIFLDFELKDCNIEKTRLFTIKRKIKERHGRTTDLKVYLGTVSPQTELTDDMATLQEMGIEGAEKSEINEPEEVVLYYDFKPYQHNDPLLLVETHQ